ncbi:type II toxin-antitoxin system VapC family toxin [Aquamicrobium sp. LC103]|uniref:type II toxin-antitoxin system VapC family toxin n=1 Tax=Aquamicrobium sp. LC103 TaxID=1120658 RepID=UPI00063E84A5|nr:type II toxin-antitoxin system VapC family toxin [Aquamicrobium sp. LC103]TKT82970.1 type II toxin-antitoxin system VapC family toxin [Aquamicrobium sp. LC103]
MYLIDTNTFSDAHKGVPEPVAWLSSVDSGSVYLSVITLGEIERGIEMVRASKPAKARELEKWLQTLRQENGDRILPITEDVALEWGRLSARHRRGEADALIAATAIVHGLTVVTRNIADFDGTGVAVLNPWSDAPA